MREQAQKSIEQVMQEACDWQYSRGGVDFREVQVATPRGFRNSTPVLPIVQTDDVFAALSRMSDCG